MTTLKKVRKAVLPAAGLGTRFLPATKAQPKEMLPVVDKPLIQYSVEECINSGIENIIIVTGRGKHAIEDHFDKSPGLEHLLDSTGKKDLADIVRHISGMAHVSYIRQKEPKGLGHAVLTARELVGDEPFAVLLGDVIMDGPDPATKQLVEVYEATGLSAVAVEPVPMESVHLYGVVDAIVDKDGRWPGRSMKIKSVVEKPKASEAPSNLSVTGRYVFTPEIFDYIERTLPGRGGEIQLADAMRDLAKGQGMYGLICLGKTYDAGDKLGFLKATVEMALKNPEFAEEFRDYLKGLKL